jgi:hypothetical protein
VKITDFAVATIVLVIVAVAVVLPSLRYHSGKENLSCINNLRQIEGAENEWALENGKTNGAIVTVTDFSPYIQLGPHGEFPSCPRGGTYILRPIGENPICSYHGDLIKSNAQAPYYLRPAQ